MHDLPPIAFDEFWFYPIISLSGICTQIKWRGVTLPNLEDED